MVRRVTGKVQEEQIQDDLEKYRRKTIDLGGSDAKIIKSDIIVIDERVRAKCMYPQCPSYGLSMHCPPHAPELDEIRKLFRKYRYGILIKLDVPSKEIAGPHAKENRAWMPYGLKRNEIVAKLETEAFHDGYHFAVGFVGGSCKDYFCPDLECNVLKGQICRAPLKARSSMEAAGIDAFSLATNVGWNIYPIGENTSPAKVPGGLLLGLVLIC